MKYNLPLIVLIFSILCSSNAIHAQCKGFQKKADLSLLNGFDFCGEVQSALMNSADSAVVPLQLAERKKYRILVDNQEYIGTPQVFVINSSLDTISTQLVFTQKRYWEVFSKFDEQVSIHIKFQKRKVRHQEMNAAACVLLAVGKIEFDEVVSAPAESGIDL